MSGEIQVIRKYKGVKIMSIKCDYPSYSSSFHTKNGLIHLIGIRKLRCIKKLIDSILEEEQLQEADK